MRILTFAATSSSKSINKQLASYAASQLDNADIEILDINDYELPLFSEDKELELGQPYLAKKFIDKIATSDALIIAFAEHNGSYTAAYKNIFDWASRVNPKVFQNKPVVMLATSPGPGGASSVLATAISSAPFFDGVVKGSLSVPDFYENFDSEQGKIINDEINERLITAVNNLI
ncbi:MAG: NADPH-dependent FMN reductase [endosymbiont of Galathealinum brachiosum]|uniref:NADPH-dependent FMN reductase n=1 Tax=endosymbiont of Galathealinum brachiosum TaxID=2200906 RepID=A0A370DGY9_9GAMM|nr:MAG: NADPH-dependent FMN reductase [endosymbiont of Galathealinum brachiosum]